jgi:hypothetical protein
VEDPKVAVKWDELLEAFLFVNSAPVGENKARLFIASGEIRRDSVWTEVWAESDGDDGAAKDPGGEALDIPHKTELGLGRELALWFVEEVIPDRHEEVAGFFEKRGAYAKFKALLGEEGLLQQWYEFEHEAEEQALRNWCEENGVSPL